MKTADLARCLRRREIGIRLAVAASRMRIARQLFVENLTLSALGGVAGLAGGRWVPARRAARIDPMRFLRAE